MTRAERGRPRASVVPPRAATVEVDDARDRVTIAIHGVVVGLDMTRAEAVALSEALSAWRTSEQDGARCWACGS